MKPMDAALRQKVDQFKDDMQLSAWKGKHWSERERAFNEQLEQLVADATSKTEAEAVRQEIREYSDPGEGNFNIVDDNGIIIWE